MIRKPILFLALLLLLGLSAVPAFAQSELTFTVHRDFGYGNGSQIRGNFSMQVTSPTALKSVAFKIDGAVIQEVTAAPFKISFTTSSYPDGWHELTATAVTADGRTIDSSPKRFNFVSAAEQTTGMKTIILPVLGAALGLMVLMAAGQYFIFRGRRRETVPLGAQRNYGISGGTICPRCERPFPLHWWGLNLIGGKLDTCDHCGRWGIYHRRKPAELARAEAAELEAAQPETPIHEPTPEEKLKQQLEQSRYQDL